VPGVLVIPSLISLVLWLIVLAMQAFAFGDAAMRPAEAFTATDKQTKPFWLIVLGLAIVISLLHQGQVMGLLNLLGVVAAAVYLAGVRPAVREIGRPRRGDGPYGPW